MLDASYHLIQRLSRSNQVWFVEGDDYVEGSTAQNDTIAYVTDNAFKLPSSLDTLRLTDFNDDPSLKSNVIDGYFPQDFGFTDEAEANMIGSDSSQQQYRFRMDVTDIDAAGYLGVLVFVNIFYLSLMLLLTWMVVYVRNRTRHGPNHSLSRQIGDRVFFANFLFL